VIYIIDVGLGNRRSVYNWLFQMGYKVQLLKKPSDYHSGHIVIPGVSSSNRLVKAMVKNEMDNVVSRCVEVGDVLMGICAGFQALGVSTTEDGYVECLGHLPLITEKMSLGERIGRNGWENCRINTLEFPENKRRNFGKKKSIHGRAYFNHEYGVTLTESTTLNSSHWYIDEKKHLALYIQNNVIGLQFHPEKSAGFGRELAKVFK